MIRLGYVRRAGVPAALATGFLACLGLALGSSAACRSQPSTGAAGGRPDIVLISIDTLRADHVGAYGYPRSTSPFLDSLARESKLFTNVFVPLPATNPSHASLFTALHPLQHGVLDNSMALPREAETLAEVLQRNGYFTMGVVANTHIGRGYNFDQGFELFSEDPLVPVPGEHQRFGDDVSNAAIDFLEAYTRQRRGQSYFLFVHYFDVHTPYRKHALEPPEPLPPEVLRFKDRGRTQRLTRRYDSEIRFVDQQIQRLVEALEKLKLDRNLILCVTADHGEQLGDHGYSAGHFDLYRETVRVPLFFHGARIVPGVVETAVSSMDTPVSILAAARLSFSGAVAGRNNLVTLGSSSRPAGAEKRPFLVLGYPNFTRSLVAIRDHFWYVRNLDFLYKRLLVEKSVPNAAAVPPGMKEARLLRSGETGSLYVTPLDMVPGKIRPVYVSAEIRLAKPGCTAELKPAVEPSLAYLEHPMRLKRSMRIHYPASSRDVTSLLIHPGDCVAGVYYGVDEFSELARREGEPGLEAADTHAWKQLKTERKARPTNELYDVAEDPAMTRNRIDAPDLQATARELDDAIDSLWKEHSRGAFNSQIVRPDLTPEEAESLRSLGYLE